MNCDEVREQLIDFIEEELPRRQTKMIQQHLESCVECKQEAREYDSVLTSLVDAVQDPGDEYFSRLYPQIMERIERNEGLVWYKRIFKNGGPFKKLTLVAAPALVALFIVSLSIFPRIFGAAPVGPDGEKVHTTAKTMVIRHSVMPPRNGVVYVSDMSDLEVEELHNALMVTLEDVMVNPPRNDDDDFRAVSVTPLDAAGMSPNLGGLDSDGWGEVMNKLANFDENAI